MIIIDTQAGFKSDTAGSPVSFDLLFRVPVPIVQF